MRDDRAVAVAIAISMVSSVSVTVPIWLTFTRIALATSSSMPRARNSLFVTKRSSPTSWQRSPSAAVSLAQPFQSPSASPSSMDTMGYLSQPAGVQLDDLVGGLRAAAALLERVLARENSSLDAQSSASATATPGS
jgi:hypothetical protein